MAFIRKLRDGNVRLSRHALLARAEAGGSENAVVVDVGGGRTWPFGATPKGCAIAHRYPDCCNIRPYPSRWPLHCRAIRHGLARQALAIKALSSMPLFVLEQQR